MGSQWQWRVIEDIAVIDRAQTIRRYSKRYIYIYIRNLSLLYFIVSIFFSVRRVSKVEGHAMLFVLM